MHLRNILSQLLNLKNTVIESFECLESKKEVVISVRPKASMRFRCGECGKKASFYDNGRNTARYWRTRNFGGMKVFLKSNLSRVKCRKCGIVTQMVPWARKKSGFTYEFEQEITWLALHMSKSALSQYMEIAWKTVGEITGRIYQDIEKTRDSLFSNLRKIGIDETSYRKGHKYITVVVNHETGNLIWAHEGHSKETLSKFFEILTEEQRESIELVSGDGARWIAACVEQYCPNAQRCIDPFHVVGWCMDALDSVRKEAWRDARSKVKKSPKRGRGRPKKNEPKMDDAADKIKGSKYALGKNPENLTENQRLKLDLLAKSDPRLYRAYLLKEKLRNVFHMNAREENGLQEIKDEIDSWLKWAQRSRIKAFVELQKKIRRHYDAIVSTMQHGLSNARIESMNNKIKLSIRMAYGFRNMDNMLSMIMLRCSGIHVSLP